MVLVPPLTWQGPAGAAVLSAGTHGQMPQLQHSWEEHGQQMASLAVPRRAPLQAWGQGHFSAGGMGMNLQARDLLP